MLTSEATDCPLPPMQVKVYEVEATSVETAFDSVSRSCAGLTHDIYALCHFQNAWRLTPPPLVQVYLDASRKHDAGTSPFSTSDSAIIIVNFDKLRMDPHKAANAGPAVGVTLMLRPLPWEKGGPKGGRHLLARGAALTYELLRRPAASTCPGV